MRRRAASLAASVFVAGGALAGVDTYSQKGREGGIAPNPPAAPQGAAPLIGQEPTSDPLTVNVSVNSSAPGAAGGVAGAGAPGSGAAVEATWMSPQAVTAANGETSLVLKVDAGASSVRQAIFFFDGAVRSGSTTTRRHVVEEVVQLESPQTGELEDHFVLDVELLNRQPRRVHAVLALVGGAPSHRVPGARVISYEFASRPDGAPIFVWSASGEFGDQINLANSPIEQNVVVFYAQHIGHYPYLWEGLRIHGVVPQAVDLEGHLAQARLDVSERIPDPDWDGYAVLDFEAWFAGWEWCPDLYREESERLVRLDHPQMPDADVERMAIARYERAAERFLLETLRVCQEERPNAKWGFYGIPYAEEASPTVVRVLSAADALYPNAYMVYKGVGRDEEPGPGQTFAHWSHASISARVSNAREIAGDKPVLTFVWLKYHDINPVYANRLLEKQDLEMMLRTPIEAGANGLLFWGHLNDRTDLQAQQGDVNKRVTPILMDLIRESQP